MSLQEAISEEEETATQALCLRVNADADPGALARVLTCFQTLNVVPRRVVAELGTTGTLYIRIDVTGLTERHLLADRRQGRASALRWERLLAPSVADG